MRLGDEVGGRFRLVRRAGAGGMGVVFHADDLERGGPVAVKIVAGSALELERFTREAEVLAGIDDPRIVRYLAHGAHGDARYLALEWLDGEDLSRRLARGPMDEDEVLRLAHGLAEALAVLHARGVVHRDIKPSNVFLVGGSVDAVKLLDLGVARDLSGGLGLTATGATIGTPAYMAPEQARGEPVDARADLFALGCLLFESLTGRTPFHADHPIAALARLLFEDAPRLADLRPDLGAALTGLVDALLARDRELRPKGAAAVLALLRDAPAPGPSAPAPLPAISGAEQRIVSLVLTRPATAGGATLLAQESGDLERRVRAAAQAAGALLERLPGGAYLALFTGGGVPTDHAVRAAAFALGLAPLLGADVIALATGRGELAPRPRPGEPARHRSLVGAVVERALALLEGGAGIQLDPGAAELLADRFEVLVDGERRQLLGARDVREPRRTLLGRVTACVGRERELAALAAALATSVEGPLASAVLLTAPPGVGKSRLVDEFLRSARGHADVARVIVGGCDVMSAGSPFAALARALRRDLREGDLGARLPAWTRELLRELCGLVRAGEASDKLTRLRADPVMLSDALADAFRALVAAETDAGALVLVLEDLHWGDLPSLQVIDAALRVHEARPFFVVATARPEVHELFPRLWHDRGVQELRLGALGRRPAERLARQVLGPDAGDAAIARLVERAAGHPLLLEEILRAAATGREHEVPDGVLGVVQARFDGLPEDARAALRAASVFGSTFWLGGVAALLGAAPPPVPSTTARSATPRSTTPRTLDHPTLVAPRSPSRRDATTAVDPPAPRDGATPPPAARRLAEGTTPPPRDGATPPPRDGATPPPREVATPPPAEFRLAEGATPPPAERRLAEVAALLDRLVDAEFIAPARDARLADQREYAFRHALIRDAAYATLVEADRAAGHRLAGAWLEAAGETDALALAEHLDRGLEPVRAAMWYRRAAEDALEGNDTAAAIRLAERALACAPQDPGPAHLVLAEAHYWRGAMAPARAAAEGALAVAEPGSDAWYTALGALIQSAGQLGDNDEVEACLARALAVDGPVTDARLICIARGACQITYVSYERVEPYRARLDALAAAADPGPLARGWLERVRVESTPHYRLRADSAAGFQRARASFEAAGALRYAGLVRIFECRAHSHTGDPRAALAELDAVAADIDRLGVPFLRFFVALERSVALFYDGQDDAALEGMRRHELSARSSRRIGAVVALYRAQIALDAGDPQAVLGLVDEICDSDLVPSLRAPAYGLRARALLRLQRPDEALAAADEALRQSAHAQPDVFDEVGPLGAAEVLLAHGQIDRTRDLVADRWHHLRGLPIDAVARERILRRRIIRDLTALAVRFGLHPPAAAPDPSSAPPSAPPSAPAS